MERRNVHEA